MKSPQQVLREIGHRPRKRFGQNFLIHEDTARKIAGWASPRPGDTIVEIGPGLGALTERLLEIGSPVLAIERDTSLASHLNERWKDRPDFQLLTADVREIDFTTLPRERESLLHIVSNLPYSESTPILEHLLGFREIIRKMSLMFQSELVDRIVAHPGTKDYGRLTVWIQSCWDVQAGPTISPGNFFPRPEVTSRLVCLTPRAEPLISDEEMTPFLAFVASLFGHRRKTIRATLRLAGVDKERIEASAGRLGISSDSRPEELSISKLYELFRELRSAMKL